MTRTATPDPTYLSALGEVTFVFAVLEWQAAYICDALRGDGYLTTTRTKTAGQLASDLIDSVRSAKLDHDVKSQFEAFALRFKDLVRRRNDVMHARPITAPGTDRTPALSRITADGESVSFLTAEDLTEVASQFDDANLIGNKLFYTFLRI